MHVQLSIYYFNVDKKPSELRELLGEQAITTAILLYYLELELFIGQDDTFKWEQLSCEA